MIPASTLILPRPAQAPIERISEQMGTCSAPRQRLPVTSGAQSDAAWLWRCVDLADAAGLTAQSVQYIGCGARQHSDAYRVRSHSGISPVIYTPYAGATSYATSYAHDGAWRCQCVAGAVGSPCQHVGAAYLLACQRDAARKQAQERAQRAAVEGIRSTQTLAKALDERLSALKVECHQQAAVYGWNAPSVRQFSDAIGYFEMRYRAVASQLAALATTVYH